MNDTREIAYNAFHTMDNNPCQFEIGQELLILRDGECIKVIPHTICWDETFGGWLLSYGSIGIHEQNFISAIEKDKWEPHEAGLWSYWTRRKYEY